MKITVFGSSGPLGIELIKQALDRGHEVIAYARNPKKLHDHTHERLTIIEGKLTDQQKIEQAVTGVDAVISVLGPKGRLKDTELSDGIQNIIESMNKVGTKRLVALSTGSVKDPQDRFDLTYSILVLLIRIIANSAYQEIIRMGKLIRSSNLDWTLVRVGFLNDDGVKPVKVGYYGHGNVNVKISRSSVAKFMLDQVESGEYIRKSPAISN
ncbi:putative NADH-flavin reductase [Caldalkalibacillus uzonensis]|uniref:NADH-flavin reductase n=1 Tax=Caldalkalibacillus uzonensis TaxID=353224 RepID=A0ABU0CYD0_9BACI|nr:SDR family oxidoreductase [Caldalkalibacillus uzonensis]MDQ0341161.1 putative NADH-flavin reductase [Caldalkalibacillus uzonensis]